MADASGKTAESTGPKKTFLRDATGLVKEISLRNAVFFAVSSGIGIAAFSISFVALYPTNMIYGVPIFVWALLITAVTEFFFGLTYVFLAYIVPRSGGDYVATTRIFSPAWGFIEGITYAGAWLTAGGLNYWYMMTTMGDSLKLGALMSNGSALVSAGNWLTSTEGSLIVSIPFFLFFFFLFGFRQTKTYITANTITIGLAIFASVILLFTFVALSPSTSTIQANLLKVSGFSSIQALENAATAGGFSPGYTVSGFGALLLFMVFAFLGYQNNFYIAGEIKGQASKATYYGAIACILVLVFYYSVYWIPFAYAGGYNVINSWSYLFWTGSSSTPLGGSPPNSAAILALADPSLAGVAIPLGIISMTLADIGIVYVAVTIAIRMIFAASMDRLLPSWFGSISSRTFTPVKTTIIVLALVYLTYIANILGVNPATTLYASILLALPTYIFPSLNILLMKRRRPELWNMAPKSWIRKIAGIPAISLVSVAWLIFAIPVFGIFVFYPIITSAASSSSVLSFASSSGVLVSVVIFVLAAVIYYGARTYNKSRGVDVELLFKTIPPE